MDANGTRFHLLLGEADWRRCMDATLAWDARRAEVTLRERAFRFASSPGTRPPALADRRGAGRDRYGNWYWIAGSQAEILVTSVGSGATSHFWSAGDGVECAPAPDTGGFEALAPPAPAAPARLSGLAVTEDHYLVAGVLEPAGLLIFDLHASNPPRQVCWPAGLDFAPFDMAPAPGGGAWVLDRANRRFWRLDRHLNVVRHGQPEATLPPAPPEPFEPVDGSPRPAAGARTFPAGIALDAASPVRAVDPVAIEGLRDGSVLVLDRSAGAARIHRHRPGEPPDAPLSTETLSALVEPSPRPWALAGHDFAFVPAHEGRAGAVPDRLYIVADGGDQAFAFDVRRPPEPAGVPLELTPVAEYFPMRLFGGKGLVAAGDQAYYDSDERWIPLVDQRRPRYALEATLQCPATEAAPHPENTRPIAFDGKAPDCVWHRLMLDAGIPPTTRVQVWSRAANELRELAGAEWQAEPAPHLRRDGSELPFAGRPPAGAEGTWELLFQRARGRFLQLRLGLRGDGRSTPRLRALRAYYPRFSYLERYLPAVYREDADSASFLDRFLANLEGFYTGIEDEVGAAQILWDVRSAPADALGWLARWYGLALDPRWEPARRRLFLAHAMDFLQFRGTLPGLRMALSLALDPCADDADFGGRPPRPVRGSGIRIIERFRTRRTPGVALGDPTELTGPRRVARSRRWLPGQGRDELRRRFTESLDPAAAAAGRLGDFSLAEPAVREAAAAWRRFAQETLGFVPAATPADRARWQRFLARRYHRIGALNTAWGLTGSQELGAFEDVPLPTALPADGAPLQNWYQFESVVLPMRQAAHQFTVLLPVPITRPLTAAEHRRRFDVATRVVEAEKPAHTVFDVKFYWAAFRLGAARLGEDTVLGQGSRAPQLLPPMVLGEGYLAESYLAPGYPQDVAERQVLDRDRLRRSPTPAQGITP